MSTPAVMTAFTSGLAEINLAEDDSVGGDAGAARIKDASAAIYDMAAQHAAAGALWNWGMHDPEQLAEIRDLLPGFAESGTDGFSEQLYYRALRGLPGGLAAVADKDVLEVGCGMGEGLNFLSRLVPTARMVGLDLSAGAVARATATLSRGAGLTYVHGDAEDLPFPDASVDVLVNIESSHTYPNLGRFLSEVERVLRPGGHLTHIDVFTRQRHAAMRRVREQIPGLEWTVDEDLSEFVRAAVRGRMAADSHFRRELGKRRMNRLVRELTAHGQILMHGGMFAGYEPSRTIKVLAKLGVVPWMTGLPMESYRHQVAVRR
ncbi:class I SAM-dependent methyltransferase [Actinokineospora sp. 24-640]